MSETLGRDWTYPLPEHVLNGVSAARSMADIQDVVSQFLGDIGFKKLTYHLVRVDGFGDHLLSFISDYPEEWLQRYVSLGYIHHDLVHTRGRKTVLPVQWAGLQRGALTVESSRVFDEAREFGLIDGLSIPVHGPHSFALFSAVADGTARERAVAMERSRDALTILALHVHERARTLLDLIVRQVSDTQANLTARERECLQWLAAGKTGPQIATILNITDATANQHIQSCVRKLNATTRTHAAVKAIVMGLVEPG